MRIIFLGSPKEVLAPLRALMAMKEHELLAVVSQPAKPQGRKRQLKDPFVASFAKEHQIKVFQPESAKDPDFLSELRALTPDLMVTAAYGQILTEEFLAIPKRGTINLHPSLLPRYRGATPVQTALLNGDTKTGMSILFTVKKLDAGALILSKEAQIKEHETTKDLLTRMFTLGAEMLPLALDLLKDPGFKGSPQDEAGVVHCAKIQKTDGAIDWRKSAFSLYCRFRAFDPWPGSYAMLQGRRVVILGLGLDSGLDSGLAAHDKMAPKRNPGSFVFNKAAKALEVACGEDGAQTLCITRVKPAGGKEQDAAAFFNGLKLDGKGQFDGI